MFYNDSDDTCLGSCTRTTFKICTLSRLVLLMAEKTVRVRWKPGIKEREGYTPQLYE